MIPLRELSRDTLTKPFTELVLAECFRLQSCLMLVSLHYTKSFIFVQRKPRSLAWSLFLFLGNRYLIDLNTALVISAQHMTSMVVLKRCLFEGEREADTNTRDTARWTRKGRYIQLIPANYATFPSLENFLPAADWVIPHHLYTKNNNNNNDQSIQELKFSLVVGFSNSGQ